MAPTDIEKKASETCVENTFGIFKTITARKVARDKIRQNHPGILALNPLRTEKEMVDLGK